eukprot:2500859-Prymnesium_polylepis.1
MSTRAPHETRNVCSVALAKASLLCQGLDRLTLTENSIGTARRAREYVSKAWPCAGLHQLRQLVRALPAGGVKPKFFGRTRQWLLLGTGSLGSRDVSQMYRAAPMHRVTPPAHQRGLRSEGCDGSSRLSRRSDRSIIFCVRGSDSRNVAHRTYSAPPPG